MKSWLMIVVLVLVVASAFLFFNDSSVNLAPSKPYRAGLPDLTVNISINNVLNNSFNGSVQFLVNYTIVYKNIVNVASTNVTAMSGNSMNCIGGWGSGGAGTFPIPALSPNQAIVSQSSSMVNCHGNWSASATVDYTNVLTELSETNNNANVAISI